MISPDTMPTALQTSAKRVFSIFAIVVLLLTLLVVPPKPFEADAQVTLLRRPRRRSARVVRQ